MNPANVPSSRFLPDIGLAPAMRVLDVGCGNGDLSRMIAELVGAEGEVVGIDRNEAALASARVVPPSPKSAPIGYYIADLNGELPDLGLFDAIVGRRVLMYLPDVRTTLLQLAKLARPGTILAFQEHARADLPSAAGDLPLHRKCYEMMWDTVAAENGDVTLGYRLADMVRTAGFTIEQARSEGVLIQPWEESFVPTLTRLMLPRMVEQDVARKDEIDMASLASSIQKEQKAAGGTILWDMAFVVSGRFESDG